eukprot:4096277-Prorocentrum_lima.AAC.1
MYTPALFLEEDRTIWIGQAWVDLEVAYVDYICVTQGLHVIDVGEEDAHRTAFRSDHTLLK